MIGSRDCLTNLVFTNPQIFPTKFAACFDLPLADFCLGIKTYKKCQYDLVGIHFYQKSKKLDEIGKIRETLLF